MTKKQLFTGLVVLLILAALTLVIFHFSSPSSETQISSEEEKALESLTAFLNALNSGDYSAAASLYGGSYEILTGYNADIDPTEHGVLLERACTTNGFNCLQLKSVLSTQAISEDEFSFYVELQLDNGNLFEIGPCCGEDEEGFVPMSTFEFRVIKTDSGQYQVLDLPPYTP